jgi:hypothetical protein
MAVGSRATISDAERRFPVRIRMALPAGGFGQRLDVRHAWLDQNCGADEWMKTLARLRGVANDAVAIYFRGAALAGALVTGWCRRRLQRARSSSATMVPCRHVPRRGIGHSDVTEAPHGPVYRN